MGMRPDFTLVAAQMSLFRRGISRMVFLEVSESLTRRGALFIHLRISEAGTSISTDLRQRVDWHAVSCQLLASSQRDSDTQRKV